MGDAGAEDGELSDSAAPEDGAVCTFLGRHPEKNIAARCESLSSFVSPSPSHRLTPSALSRTGSIARRKWFGCSMIDDFEVLDKVGEGTFGYALGGGALTGSEVHKARHRKSGKVVALKKILSRTEQEGFPITALREIKLLKALKHSNIVELLDMATSSGEAAAIFMVFPYMDHDLTGLLESEKAQFSVAQIKCYMKQLFEGIRYLHRAAILHRDIKGSNILINNRGELRVTDFGLARPLEENRKHYTPGVVTRWYRPPELLYGATEYGTAVDLWGAGCVLAEMYIKRPLFPGDSDLNQLELIARLCGTPSEKNMPEASLLPDFAKIRLPNHHRRVVEDFGKIDPLAADLIDKLLVLDPNKRLTAEQALEHSYFRTHPLPALPQSYTAAWRCAHLDRLPSYESSHEYDRVKRKNMRAPHPTPHEHAAHSSSHVLWSPPRRKSPLPPPPPPDDERTELRRRFPAAPEQHARLNTRAAAPFKGPLLDKRDDRPVERRRDYSSIPHDHSHRHTYDRSYDRQYEYECDREYYRRDRDVDRRGYDRDRGDYDYDHDRRGYRDYDRPAEYRDVYISGARRDRLEYDEYPEHAQKTPYDRSQSRERVEQNHPLRDRREYPNNRHYRHD